MSIREEIFSKLEAICRDSGLDFEKTSQDMSEFISNEEIVAYCITQGPLPSFEDTVFDIMVLSNKCLCDYDMKQQGALHHILPLKTIIGISESFEKEEDEDYLSVTFRSSALGTGLVFEGKMTDKKNIREFSKAVAKKIFESS